jgi:formaldehyde-activating enzyme involved in methanogenesis
MELEYNHAKSDNTDGLVVLCSHFVSIGFDDDRDLYQMVH